MRRRRDPFGRTDAQGDQSIAFDQADPAPADPTAPVPDAAPAPEEDALPTNHPTAPQGVEDMSMPEGQGQTGMLAALGGQPDPMTPAGPEGAPLTTDQVSDTDLASLQEPLQSPEDMDADAMEAAMNDPNTSPEDRQMLEQEMALAARRRMAGM